jgi:predicted nucleic-acid-binding Zn-ribbon protein
MMEIISKPKMKKCKKCGCEFTYEDEDTIRHTRINITDPHYGYISVDIKCPQCDNEIYLGEELDLELRREKLDYDANSKRRNKLEGVFDIL